jgi:hypothetical protein
MAVCLAAFHCSIGFTGCQDKRPLGHVTKVKKSNSQPHAVSDASKSRLCTLARKLFLLSARCVTQLVAELTHDAVSSTTASI